MIRRMIISLFIACLGLHVVQAQDSATPPETLSEAQRELAERWAKVQSLTADSRIVNNVRYEGGNTTVDSSGSFEFAKRENKPFLRWDIKAETTIRKEGQDEVKKPSHTLTVTDGNHTWVMVERDGTAKVRKTRIDPVYHLDVNALFDSLRSRGAVRELAEDKVDGVPVRVFVADIKQDDKLTGNVAYYFAKDTGLLMRTVTAAAGGTVTSQLSGVKYNVDIPSDRFKFDPPEGAEFSDHSGTP